MAAAQRPRLVELGLERLFREIELPLVRVLAQMEAAGVKMDPYRLGEITARVRDRIDELNDEIVRLAGGPFTIGSPQQLAEVLFGRLGLEPARKGKTGFSTDARVLRGLRDRHPIVPAVEEWRELTKLLNTYLEPLPEHIDARTGRVHSSFNQLVAATGRLSSNNPNLQNIPVRTRARRGDPGLLHRRGWSQAGRRRLLSDRAAVDGLALAGAGAPRGVPSR